MEDLMISKIDEHLLINNSVYKDSSNGYYKIRLKDGTRTYLHRIIAGANKGQIVDHVNRNKNDNRRENLRICSISLNNYNTNVVNKNGRGIYFDKYGNRFRACISHKNKTLKLGSIKNIKDAKIAYNKKAKKLYGDDAFQHSLED